MNTLTTGEKIAKAAIAWLGTPYANNSMVKGAGVDCSYLLVAAVVDSGLMKSDRLQIRKLLKTSGIYTTQRRNISNTCNK